MRTELPIALNTSPELADLECPVQPSAEYTLLAVAEERLRDGFLHYTLEEVRGRKEVFVKEVYWNRDGEPRCDKVVKLPSEHEPFQLVTIALRNAADFPCGEDNFEYTEYHYTASVRVSAQTTVARTHITVCNVKCLQHSEEELNAIHYDGDRERVRRGAEVLDALDDYRRERG